MSDHIKPINLKKARNKLGYIDSTVAGIDIGANLIHVSIPNKESSTDVLEFGTTTPDLKEIANKLEQAGVRTAVMESTGLLFMKFWKTMVLSLFWLMRKLSKMHQVVKQMSLTANGYKLFIQMAS